MLTCSEAYLFTYIFPKVSKKTSIIPYFPIHSEKNCQNLSNQKRIGKAFGLTLLRMSDLKVKYAMMKVII